MVTEFAPIDETLVKQHSHQSQTPCEPSREDHEPDQPDKLEHPVDLDFPFEEQPIVIENFPASHFDVLNIVHNVLHQPHSGILGLQQPFGQLGSRCVNKDQNRNGNNVGSKHRQNGVLQKNPDVDGAG